MLRPYKFRLNEYIQDEIEIEILRRSFSDHLRITNLLLAPGSQRATAKAAASRRTPKASGLKASATDGPELQLRGVRRAACAGCR
jgi:hypothetical protein